MEIHDGNEKTARLNWLVKSLPWAMLLLVLFLAWLFSYQWRHMTHQTSEAVSPMQATPLACDRLYYRYDAVAGVQVEEDRLLLSFWDGPDFSFPIEEGAIPDSALQATYQRLKDGKSVYLSIEPARKEGYGPIQVFSFFEKNESDKEDCLRSLDKLELPERMQSERTGHGQESAKEPLVMNTGG